MWEEILRIRIQQKLDQIAAEMRDNLEVAIRQAMNDAVDRFEKRLRAMNTPTAQDE